MYCHKTEWIPVNAKIPMCSQCKRIRTTQLTLDGLRLKKQKKFVDKNEEARLIRRFYYTEIRRRLEFMLVLFLFSLENVCDKSRIAISVDQPNGFLLIKETVHSV